MDLSSRAHFERTNQPPKRLAIRGPRYCWRDFAILVRAFSISRVDVSACGGDPNMSKKENETKKDGMKRDKQRD